MSQPTSPPGRQVVVLRQGPPKHRSAIIDGVVGVVGVALLVFAGVLGQTLPEEEVVPVQYLPDFPLNSTNALLRYVDPNGDEHFSGSLVFNGMGDNPPMLLERDSVDIDILVEHDNIISFNVRALIKADEINGDDIPSSLPDTFKFQLYDPDGEPIESHWRVPTAAPQEVPPDPEDPFNVTRMYISPIVMESKIVRFRSQPEAEFIGSNDTSFSREDALLVASERYTLPSKGTVWRLNIELTNAGDCEAPGANPQAMHRVAHCRSLSEDGSDPGNPIILSQVLYDYYLIEIPE